MIEKKEHMKISLDVQKSVAHFMQYGQLVFGNGLLLTWWLKDFKADASPLFA